MEGDINHDLRHSGISSTWLFISYAKELCFFSNKADVCLHPYVESEKQHRFHLLFETEFSKQLKDYN